MKWIYLFSDLISLRRGEEKHDMTLKCALVGCGSKRSATSATVSEKISAGCVRESGSTCISLLYAKKT